MGWIIEGPWSSQDGKHYMADMSDVSHYGGMEDTFAPNTKCLLSEIKWTEQRDDEGEILMWKAEYSGMSLAIFND